MHQIVIPTAKIRGSVLGGHVVLLLALALSGMVELWRTPKPEVVRVNLVTLPADPTPAAVVPSPPAPQPLPPQPEPVKPPPEPVSKPPPKPTIPPPPTVKTPAKTVAVKPKPTPKPKPKKPQWVANKAEDIRRNAKLTPTRPAPSRPVAKVDPNEIAARLNNRVRQLNVVPTVKAVGGSASGAETARYLDVVGATLHGMWRQPTRSQVGGGHPRTSVKITVLPNGRVTAKGLGNRSGVVAMDSSVARLLTKLERLPPYRDYGVTGRSLEISVVFELD